MRISRTAFFYAAVLGMLSVIPHVVSAQADDAVQVTVGGKTVTARQLRFQMSAAKCLGDQSITRGRATGKLIMQALESEVMDLYFKDHPDDSFIQKRADYIQSTASDPDRLKCVMASGDRETYLSIFVRPTIIASRIRYRYFKDSSAHPAETRTFDQWYHQYVLDHVPILFTNHALEDEVRDAFATMWWLRAIKERS